MNAIESLDLEVYRRLHHGIVFKELGRFKLEGDCFRFNCPECERNQVKAKNTFFARKGLPYGRCRLCGYGLSWWGKYGAGSKGLQGLAKLLGISYESFAPESHPHLLKALRHSQLLEELIHFTTCFLLEDPRAESLAYLYARGFRMEEIKETELGCYPPCEEVKKYMLSQGYSLDELEEVGVLAPELETRYKLVLPYRSGSGRALGMLAYSPVGGMGRPDRRLFCSKEATVPFHLNVALRDKEFGDSRWLIVVDEPLEATMLGPLGVGNAIAPVGSSLSREGLALLEKHGVKELIFCLREANPEKVNELASAFANLEGIGLYTVELRVARDLVEYIRLMGHEAWRRLLTKPTALPKEVPGRKVVAKEKPAVTLKEGQPATVKSEVGPAPAEKAKTKQVPQEEIARVGTPHEGPPMEMKGPAPFPTKEVLKRVAKRQRLKTGYARLDRIPVVSQDELSIIMGEPGCGKTLLALNMLLNMMCHHEDLCFILFSSEAAEQLTLARLLGILSEVPSSQVEEGLKGGELALEVKKGLSQLKGMGLEDRFYFFSCPDPLPEEILSCAKRVSGNGKSLGAIFIDEIHSIREGQDPLETSRRLKAMRMLAETLHTAVICTLAADSQKVLSLSNSSVLLPYTGTVLSLSTPVEGQKRMVVNVLRPPGKDTASQVVLGIKSGGGIVELE
ncbi:MAG: DnaB-like helicase C-terminal domain-containing protein [Candidatus Brocadiales bacterium]